MIFMDLDKSIYDNGQALKDVLKKEKELRTSKKRGERDWRSGGVTRGTWVEEEEEEEDVESSESYSWKAKHMR